MTLSVWQHRRIHARIRWQSQAASTGRGNLKWTARLNLDAIDYLGVEIIEDLIFAKIQQAAPVRPRYALSKPCRLSLSGPR
ncbi:hypothetical protein [Streptomyces sp. NPDC056549]|uniref:hypothetical protein n=1 Tax=Streptomyces sp. NPDC056549 TaxID=3345864 RepID=UPI0036B8CC64